MATNLDKKMLTGFSSEVRSYLPSIREGLDSFRNDSSQLEGLVDALRYIHTIKGASALMGLEALSRLTSCLEDLLGEIMDGQAVMEADEDAWLCQTVDELEPYLDSLMAGGDDEHSKITELERAFAQLNRSAPYRPRETEDESGATAGTDASPSDVISNDAMPQPFEPDGSELADRAVEDASYEAFDDGEDAESHHTLMAADGMLNEAHDSEAIPDDNLLTVDEMSIEADAVATGEHEDESDGESGAGAADEDAWQEAEVFGVQNVTDAERFFEAETDESVEEAFGSIPTFDEVEEMLNNPIADEVSSANPDGVSITTDFSDDLSESGANGLGALDDQGGGDPIERVDEPLGHASESEPLGDTEVEDETASVGEAEVTAGSIEELPSDRHLVDQDIDEAARALLYDNDDDGFVIDQTARENADDNDRAPEAVEPDTERTEDEQEEGVFEAVGAVPEDEWRGMESEAPDGVSTSPLSTEMTASVEPGALDELIRSINDEVQQVYHTATDVPPQNTFLNRANQGERYLLFTISDRWYALSVGHLLEIGRIPRITMIPNVPLWLPGVINLRGEVLSIVDLRLFLNIEEVPKLDNSRMLVVKADGDDMMTSLIVDQVKGFAQLDTTHMEMSSISLNDKFAPYLKGTYEYGDQILAVIDLERFLFSPEIRQFES